MLLLIRCALGYDMGPAARPVILPVTKPRNRAREYLKCACPAKPAGHDILLLRFSNILTCIWLIRKKIVKSLSGLSVFYLDQICSCFSHSVASLALLLLLLCCFSCSLTSLALLLLSLSCFSRSPASLVLLLLSLSFASLALSCFSRSLMLLSLSLALSLPLALSRDCCT